MAHLSETQPDKTILIQMQSAKSGPHDLGLDTPISPYVKKIAKAHDTPLLRNSTSHACIFAIKIHAPIF